MVRLLLAKIAVLVLAIGLSPNIANAALFTVTFTNVTQNSGSGSVATIANQLSVDVMDDVMAASQFGLSLASNEVLFAFSNNVGLMSSISEIYFDDGTILAQSTIFNSLGGFTQFTGPGANPGNLPGGNTVSPPFVATTSFSADAVGNPARGVDTSADILGVSYTLLSGLSLSDVSDAIDDGSLRIGLHLRAIGPFSDSFVNGPPPPDPSSAPIPEPSTLTLWSLGAVALAGFGWRRRRRVA